MTPKHCIECGRKLKLTGTKSWQAFYKCVKCGMVCEVTYGDAMGGSSDSMQWKTPAESLQGLNPKIAILDDPVTEARIRKAIKFGLDFGMGATRLKEAFAEHKQQVKKNKRKKK